MKLLMERRKPEKCGLKGTRKNRVNIMLQMLNCFRYEVKRVTSYCLSKIMKLDARHLINKLKCYLNKMINFNNFLMKLLLRMKFLKEKHKLIKKCLNNLNKPKKSMSQNLKMS